MNSEQKCFDVKAARDLIIQTKTFPFIFLKFEH